jgi:hypothetical protein
LWLSAFGVPQPQLDSFRDRWQQRLQKSSQHKIIGPRITHCL